MNSFWKIFTVAFTVSTAVVVPLMVMESVNRRGETYEFPFVLFATLWLLAAAFFIVLLGMTRRARAGGSVTSYSLVAGCLFLLVAGVFWGGLVADQMPCFLGVPNCD